jgi:hypothetical protein
MIDLHDGRSQPRRAASRATLDGDLLMHEPFSGIITDIRDRQIADGGNPADRESTAQLLTVAERLYFTGFATRSRERLRPRVTQRASTERSTPLPPDVDLRSRQVRRLGMQLKEAR